MKIDIKITEILSRVVSVEANSLDEAISKVEDMYKNEEIVLDYNDFDGNLTIKQEKLNKMVEK